MRNPATLLPALARKPNAWGESPLRGELPAGLVSRLDAMDAKERRRMPAMLRKACDASGFTPAADALDRLMDEDRTPDEASLLALARRIAQGDPPDAGDGSNRLASYDESDKPRKEGER